MSFQPPSLLLTSAGLTNPMLVEALRSMVRMPFDQSVLVFLPTAANVIAGDKTWLVENYQECRALGCKEMDIVDIGALTRAQWEPRILRADILVVGGGDTAHLLAIMGNSGFA